MTYTETWPTPRNVASKRPSQRVPSRPLKAGPFSVRPNNTFQIRGIPPPQSVKKDNYQHDLTGKFSSLEYTVVTFAGGIVHMRWGNGAFC